MNTTTDFATATIELNTLRALTVFSSTEETRYYLRSVCLEIEPFAVTYIATDGHRLMARKIFNSTENTLCGVFIVPLATCQFFKADKRKKGSDLIGQNAVLTAMPDKFFALEFNGGRTLFKMEDATYPAWRHVLSPDAAYGKAAMSITANWNYMADFEKVAKLLDLGIVTLFHGDAESPMRVQFTAGDTLAVLMPVRARGNEKLRDMPSWSERNSQLYSKAAVA